MTGNAEGSVPSLRPPCATVDRTVCLQRYTPFSLAGQEQVLDCPAGLSGAGGCPTKEAWVLSQEPPAASGEWDQV